MPKFTAEEMREIRAYERPTLALVKELTAACGVEAGSWLSSENGGTTRLGESR
jgi:hypothetical protein